VKAGGRPFLSFFTSPGQPHAAACFGAGPVLAKPAPAVLAAVGRRTHISIRGFGLENGGRRAAPAKYVVGNYHRRRRIRAFLPFGEMNALGMGAARPVGAVIGAKMARPGQ
jgi:hypothetical protein